MDVNDFTVWMILMLWIPNKEKIPSVLISEHTVKTCTDLYLKGLGSNGPFCNNYASQGRSKWPFLQIGANLMVSIATCIMKHTPKSLKNNNEFIFFYLKVPY